MYYFQTFLNPKIHGVFQILLGICRRKMTMKASQHCAKTYVIRGSDFLTALFWQDDNSRWVINSYYCDLWRK